MTSALNLNLVVILLPLIAIYVAEVFAYLQFALAECKLHRIETPR